jgi:hypothetical protein
MRFAQDDNMVDTLATNRSDQSFREAVLRRRAWGNGLRQALVHQPQFSIRLHIRHGQP